MAVSDRATLAGVNESYGANEGTMNFAILAIAIAFVIYITAKGELQKYIGFFFYTPPSANGGGTSSGQTSAPGTPLQLPGATPPTPVGGSG